MGFGQGGKGVVETEMGGSVVILDECESRSRRGEGLLGGFDAGGLEEERKGRLRRMGKPTTTS